MKAGGIVGLTLKAGQLEVKGREARTCDDLFTHWAKFAAAGSPASVALGSDVNGAISRPPAGGSCPDGIRNYGDLHQVWAGLVAAGIPREALDSMGERVLELIERVEARADPAAQAEARARARSRPLRTPFDAPGF